MKHAFKISALALVVGFGLTACKITDNVNPVKDTAEEITDKIVSVDSTGERWRNIGLQDSPFIGTTYHEDPKKHYNYLLLEGSLLNEKYANHDNNQCNQLTCKGTVFTRHNKKVRLDLDELAQKNGGSLIGTHEGYIQQASLVGKVVDAHFDQNGELITSSSEADKVNYLFTNQPYSSYGVMFTNQNDVQLFNLIQKAGVQGGKHEYGVYTDDNNRIVWNDNVKGSAIYKGSVIATVTTYHPEKFDKLQSKPMIDGTITLNANFGDTSDDNYVSGELNSKTIGKVMLPKHTFGRTLFTDSDFFPDAKINHQIDGKGNTFTGGYTAMFGGKDLNDIIGFIELKNHADVQSLNAGEVRKYDAVYGATKQPK